MHRYISAAGFSDSDIQCDAPSVAETVQDGFRGLIAILAGHLQSASDGDDEARLAIAKAKDAAERGLLLSRQLIEQLRNPALRG